MKPKSAKRASEKKHRRRPVTQGNPEGTVFPEQKAAAASVAVPAASEAPIDGQQLDAAILRFIRRFPNLTVDLAPLAAELGLDPYRLQLAVEDLHRRRMVVAPFIEPGVAGGATLTQVGLRWLLEREGGKPADVPEVLKPAKDRVRAEDEASRLPRAEVYGLVRGSSA
ncbi:MAG: hypothetical protein LC744_07435 [Chloroflexi bacterium]|nr:hypothetical protein [Chloroflexota bacterium]